MHKFRVFLASIAVFIFIGWVMEEYLPSPYSEVVIFLLFCGLVFNGFPWMAQYFMADEDTGRVYGFMAVFMSILGAILMSASTGHAIDCLTIDICTVRASQIRGGVLPSQEGIGAWMTYGSGFLTYFVLRWLIRRRAPVQPA